MLWDARFGTLPSFHRASKLVEIELLAAATSRALLVPTENFSVDEEGNLIMQRSTVYR